MFSVWSKNRFFEVQTRNNQTFKFNLLLTRNFEKWKNKGNREREKERNRETEKQRNRETEKQRNKETEKETKRQRHREKEKNGEQQPIAKVFLKPKN
jgi:hypothetical protein